MPFPNLALKPGGVMHSEGSGQPANGVNTFLLGIPPDKVNLDWLDITVIAQGPSISSTSFVGLSPDKTQLSLNFAQSGSDLATVIAKSVHSIMR